MPTITPFRRDDVVLLRAQALTRRAAGHARPQIAAGRLQLGVITLDGMALKLTAFEQRIMTCLITYRDRVISRTELSEHLYETKTDRDFKSSEVVIGRRRKKVGCGIIQTRRGEGYALRSARQPRSGTGCCGWRRSG